MDLGSSRSNARHVKTGSMIGRMFEGWQVGLVVVATAVLTALVAVPRPALPDDIPYPQLDGRALEAVSRRDEQWAQATAQTPLDFDLRAVGEAIRAYGKADADGDREAVSRRLREVRMYLVPAQAKGDEALMRLRAVQMKLFLDGVARYDQTGEESDDLREVGGGLIAMLRRSGWLRPEGQRLRVVPGRVVLEVLFRKRWNEITGLTAPPFQPSLAEERAFYAFLFEHPVVSVPAIQEKDPVVRCRTANEYLLRKMEELGRIDPTYPASYARGVVLLRLNRPREALLPLADFVDTHDDGPYVLRARNALREAQEKLAELEQ